MANFRASALWATVLSGVVFVLLGWPSALQAQPSDAELGEMGAYLDLFPALRTLSAPGWIQTGVRVSYQASGASWDGGGAGGGVVQYDVAARDARQVMAYLHSYGDGGAGLVPMSQTVVRGLPSLGAFWLNPAVLAGAEGVASPTLAVSRYDKNVGGQGVRVVRFQTTTSTGRVVHEFDEATGVVVFSSISSNGGASQLTLQSVRQLAMPWEADRAPNWVRAGTQLDYAGTKTTAVSSAGTSVQEVTVSSQMLEAGARWSLAQTTLVIRGAGQSQGASGTGGGQLGGGFWLPRSALRGAVPSEPTLVDRDPHTGAEIYFWRDPGGHILVKEVLAAAASTWGYHPQLGVLERMVLEMQTMMAQERSDLSRVGGSDLASLAAQPELPDDPQASGEPNDPGETGQPNEPGDPNGPGEPGNSEDEPGAASSEEGCAVARGQTPPFPLGAAIFVVFLLGARARKS